MLRALGSSRRRGALAALRTGLQDVWVGLRTASSAPEQPSGSSGGGDDSTASAPASKLTGAARVAKALASSFHKAPKDTANALVAQLDALDRIHLVLALQASSKQQLKEQEQTQYVEDIMKLVKSSPNKQHNRLTRQQVQSAVLFQRTLQKFSQYSEGPPTWRQLVAVGVASGLPFTVFGLLDNAIMLIAGEQIDYLFGQRLGLTMLASAALGNLVADVVGVSATQTVQNMVKKVDFARPPRLSVIQQQMFSVRAAQLIGAAVAVAAGCLVGMAPLLVMESGFFVSSGGAELAATAADAAAALGGGGEGLSEGAETVAAAVGVGDGAAAAGEEQAAAAAELQPAAASLPATPLPPDAVAAAREAAAGAATLAAPAVVAADAAAAEASATKLAAPPKAAGTATNQ